MKKIFKIIFGVSLFSNVVFGFYMVNSFFFSNTTEKNIAFSPVPVNVVKIKRGTVAVTKKFPGVVKAKESADIAFSRPGILEKINFQAGTRVKKGQLLLQLNDAEPLAEYQQALANEKLAALNYKKQETLAKSNFHTEVGKEKAYTDFVLAQAAVKKAKAVLDTTKIFAEFEGVIGMLPDLVKGSPVQPNTVLTRLVNPDAMEVVISPSQSEVKHMYRGQNVIIFVENNTDEPQISGTIKAINNVIDASSFTVSVLVSIENPPASLREGNSVLVSVTLGQQDNVLLVKKEAVESEGDGKDPAVYKVVEEGGGSKLVRKPVVLGLADGYHVEIVEGIEEDAWVVQDPSNVVDGMPVFVENRQGDAEEIGSDTKKVKEKNA